MPMPTLESVERKRKIADKAQKENAAYKPINPLAEAGKMVLSGLTSGAIPSAIKTFGGGELLKKGGLTGVASAVGDRLSGLASETFFGENTAAIQPKTPEQQAVTQQLQAQQQEQQQEQQAVAEAKPETMAQGAEKAGYIPPAAMQKGEFFAQGGGKTFTNLPGATVDQMVLPNSELQKPAITPEQEAKFQQIQGMRGSVGSILKASPEEKARGAYQRAFYGAGMTAEKQRAMQQGLQSEMRQDQQTQQRFAHEENLAKTMQGGKNDANQQKLVKGAMDNASRLVAALSKIPNPTPDQKAQLEQAMADQQQYAGQLGLASATPAAESNEQAKKPGFLARVMQGVMGKDEAQAVPGAPDAQKDAGLAPEGQRITDPKSGKVMVKQGGKWIQAAA